ncbi:MAG: alpha/beta fold hydrolase [Chloroflexi bacterium]|nr:alpha/beta fold hydrolase [Chloroflexota bacterium]
MFRRLAILVTILNLILVTSCQLSLQQDPIIVPSPTMSDLQSNGFTITPAELESTATSIDAPELTATATSTALPATSDLSPLAIANMRAKTYPGSDLVVESTLSPGQGYNRYVVSYQSDGLNLFGLLAVPTSAKPAAGWPVILLNHGYIPPGEYSTDQSYARIVAPLAEAGYIVFKPDYRGHGNSPGIPSQVYVSPDYVTDSLNALASIKKYPDANPDKIGVWGHSMGGNITLHGLVVTHDFKAAVIMAGVVGSYSGIIDWWSARVATGVLTTQNDLQTDQLVLQMVRVNGTPQTNPVFWNTIDPTSFIPNIETPLHIQVGSADLVVPPAFSQELNAQLKNAGKSVTLHVYPGSDHNLSPDTTAAMAEAVTFFNQYLK